MVRHICLQSILISTPHPVDTKQHDAIFFKSEEDWPNALTYFEPHRLGRWNRENLPSQTLSWMRLELPDPSEPIFDLSESYEDFDD